MLKSAARCVILVVSIVHSWFSFIPFHTREYVSDRLLCGEMKFRLRFKHTYFDKALTAKHSNEGVALRCDIEIICSCLKLVYSNL